jgi:haloalkane dehalogenase
VDTQSNSIEVNGLNLHYLEAGQGEVVLLLHGWPTSAYLWRNIIPTLAATKRVIALDLAGFGKSDKPLHVFYSFDFYTDLIAGFLDQLKITQANLVVHDLGGPVGLMWAVRRHQAVLRLVFLNTLIYPKLSWANRLFILATYVPYFKGRLSSSKGIKAAMRIGMTTRLDAEGIAAYQEPFQDAVSQKVLLKTVQGLSIKGLKEIAHKLPDFKIPVALIYGEDDRILKDVAQTMQHLKRDMPHAELTAIAEAGHFLQEDVPEKLSQLLADFLNR